MRNVLREIATHFFVPKCGVIRVPPARCWRIAALARYSLCSVLRGGVVRWWRVGVVGKGCELIGNGKVNVYL